MPRESNDLGEEVYRKPRPNLYTAMLLLSLLAILFGTFLLYLHMQRYGFWLDGAPAVTLWHSMDGGSWGTLPLDEAKAFPLA